MNLKECTPKDGLAPESESRRRFVTLSSITTASLALGIPGEATSSEGTSLYSPQEGANPAPLRIGMLLPDSQAYPPLGDELMKGAQVYASWARGANLHIMPVVYGNRPSQAERAAADLLASSTVNVLAGFVCANAAVQWEPMLARHGVPLLVGDAGANALAPAARTPWVVRNSLGYWQTAWATGRWAAKALGPRAIVAVGPADSAFDQLPAFERGFASAGGRVQDLLFTAAPDGTSRLEALAQKVRQTRPDFVYVLASGPDARAFRQFWNASDTASQVPLVAGGMLGEEMAGAAPASSQVWAARTHAGTSALDTHASAILPTPFHLLGFEMAQRMHAAAIHGGAQAHGLVLAKAMAQAALQTPRGEVRIDPTTGETLAPIRVQSLHRGPETAAITLSVTGATACQGLCDVLGSRALGTYLAT